MPIHLEPLAKGVLTSSWANLTIWKLKRAILVSAGGAKCPFLSRSSLFNTWTHSSMFGNSLNQPDTFKYGHFEPSRGHIGPLEAKTSDFVAGPRSEVRRRGF